MKKKLSILLVAVMMMTLLSGCVVGGDGNVDRPNMEDVMNNNQQNQPTNPEGDENSNVEEETSKVKFEGIYWLLVRKSGGGDDAFGFYLDGKGKYVEINFNEYQEYTYDGLEALEFGDYTEYMFNIYDESGEGVFRSYRVQNDGKVHVNDEIYDPVDETAFYAYAPVPEPEPSPEPTPGGDVSSYPFIGKYFLDEYDGVKIRFDAECMWMNDEIKFPLSDYEIKTSEDGTYTLITEWGSGYVYYGSDDTLMSFSEDGRSEGFYKAVSKEEYDAFGSN